MGDIKLTFGKSQVRPHARGTRTGKQIAVGAYATRRPPAKKSQVVVHDTAQWAELTEQDKRRARAAPCYHNNRTGRRMCNCSPCAVWRTIQVHKERNDRSAFKKAVDKIDSFLRDKWRRAVGLFKSETATTQDVPDQDAMDTLGASRAPGTVELADDHASARDLGPEHDEPVQGLEELPWAAEDHAAAPPIIEDAPAEIEHLDTAESDDPLSKARLLQKSLQAEIERLDQQLTQPLPDDERGQLLQKHLDYLIKADALTGRIELAEQVALLGRGRRTQP